MANRFECFFEEYKKIVKLRKPLVKKMDSETLVTVVSAMVIIALSVCSLVFWWINPIVFYIPVITAFCAIFIIANIKPYSSGGPNPEPYLDHIHRVIDLLKDYGVNSNDRAQIEAIINFTQKTIDRLDPFVDIKNAIVTTGAIAAVVIPAFSSAYEGTVNLFDSISYILIILFCILLILIALPFIYRFLTKLVFPNREKYNMLIDDLNQILMFHHQLMN